MPKRRVARDPPSDPSDPAIQAVTEILLNLFAERCDVFKLDPNSEDFWRLMSYTFAFEKLLLTEGPAAKGKKTKPKRWTADENKELVESVRKKIADGDATVEGALKALKSRFPGNLKSQVARYYEAKKAVREDQRDRIAHIILDQSPPAPPPLTRPKRTKK